MPEPIFDVRPPGTALQELDRGECLRLLGESGVGRLAFNTDEGPVIHPVNYLVDDGAIVVRTSPYSLLAQHAEHRMALEMDELEPALTLGWSVLVLADATPVEDPEEAHRIDVCGKLIAWAGGQRRMFLRLTPVRITGRRIR